MSTSATEADRAQLKGLGRRFLWISLGCAAFSLVYECFSHQVYARRMVLAFLYPLLGGALPCLILPRLHRLPRTGALYAWRAGILTAMTGSLMCGALEIYGTTNRLTAAYPVLAALLCLGALGDYLMHQEKTE